MVVDFVCGDCGRTTRLMPSVRTFVCGCGATESRGPATPVSRSHWLPLHRYAVDHAGDWDATAAMVAYREWCAAIPGFGCRACRANWDQYTATNPPDFSSAEAFFAWGVAAHNHVSVHHVRPAKPAMTLEEARWLYWPKPRGCCDDAFVAVTSLAPRACPRQTAALNSWIDFGLTIHAVNTASEVGVLRGLYPQVDGWHVSSDQTQGFSRSTATINSLADVALELNRRVLIVNADCEAYGCPRVVTDLLRDDRLVMGVRHNYAVSRDVDAVREQWGIDAFVLTPAMAAELPRLGFGIGVPVWDYWLPFHFRELGYELRLVEPAWLYHRQHVPGWLRSDWVHGASLFAVRYDYDMLNRSDAFRVGIG